MATKSKNGNGNGVEMTYTMTHKKETPGTYVYVADDPEAFVNQLYIRKAGMANGPKPTITVTVR